MKKARKIIAMILVLALTVAVSVAGTLAYLSDKDDQVNTFTTGNVAIDLWEDFGDNNEETLEKLLPSTGSAQEGTLKNQIEKEVYVTNDGSEEAYVRVHIAIPSILDNGNPDFDAGKNVLHFNAEDENLGPNKWNWGKALAKEEGEFVSTGDAWNFYTAAVNNIDYNVYVVTYEKALVKDETTLDAIYQVYLDKKVTNEDITKIKDVLGDEWNILVAAEGTQKAGFENAFEALNETFGVPGEYQFDWDTVATTSRTWINND